MTVAANDRLELWTVVGQVAVLSVGFALVFSWEADFSPKALMVMILTLLVLIYAMPDRLKNVLQKDVRELHKAHGITQTMILELRELIPNKIDLEKMTPEEKFAKAQEISEKLESFRTEFDESFEKGFQLERSESNADQIEFFGNSLAIIVYLAVVVSVSALIGWFVSSLF